MSEGQKKNMVFKKKEKPSVNIQAGLPWKLLIIDDDPQVQMLTSEVFKDLTFEGRSLVLVQGSSGSEAKQLIQEHPDTAAILLDVVMESDTAGLEVVEFIRNHLGNRLVRILLRTGQAGFFPEEEIFEKYSINDFLEKADLTSRRLKISVKVALRNFQDMQTAMELKKEADSAAQAKAEKGMLEKELAASMWQISAGVGHEMGNALLGITGLNSRLSRILNQPHDRISSEEIERARTFLTKIDNELERAKRIVTTLSGLGRKSHEKSSFIIYDVILDIVEAIKWREKAVQFVFDSNKSSTIEVYADLDSVKQILINLIKNAVHATKDKSERIVQFEINKLLGNTVISVTDNGTGISAEVLPQIYENFFTTKDRGDGTGLGLALCRTLAEESAGELSLVKTKMGKGTTFQLSLPHGKNYR